MLRFTRSASRRERASSPRSASSSYSAGLQARSASRRRLRIASLASGRRGAPTCSSTSLTSRSTNSWGAGLRPLR